MQPERTNRSGAAAFVLVAIACLGAVSAARADDEFSLGFYATPIGGGLASWGGPLLLNGAAGDVATTDSLVGELLGLTAGVWAPFNELAPPCEGDLTGDLVVDLQDLALLLVNFGVANGTPLQGDFDGDGIINLSDLSVLLVHFGTSCD